MKNITFRVLIILIFMFFFSCDNKDYTYEEFEKPEIEILSYKIISSEECEVEVKFNLGIGASFKEAYIAFWDYTTGSITMGRTKITLTKEKTQTHKVYVKVSDKKHDYKIKAVLESEKNTYSSDPQIIRFSEELVQNGIKYIELYLGHNGSDFFYVDEMNKIGKNLKKGEGFIFNVHYSKIPPTNTKTEARLNGKIAIKTDIEYTGWAENNTLSGYCTLPEDISSGIYTVHVYIDDIEYILEYKIRILSGSSRIIDVANRPGTGNYIGSLEKFFIKGNEAFFMHSSNYSEAIILETLSFNFQTKSWSVKNRLKHSAPFQNSSIIASKLQTDNNVYSLYQMYQIPWDNISKRKSIDLWEYNTNKDTWRNINSYPGIGNYKLLSFNIGNNLYIGGGFNIPDNPYLEGVDYRVYDFWKYNIIQDKWEKLEDASNSALPIHDYSSWATCNNGNNAYIFTEYRELWKYNELENKWTKLVPLKSGPYYRYNHVLLYHNNKLYLVGGFTHEGGLWGTRLQDVWEYDLTANTWALIDIFDIYYQGSETKATFIYNNKIYSGYFDTNEGKSQFVEIDLK